MHSTSLNQSWLTTSFHENCISNRLWSILNRSHTFKDRKRNCAICDHCNWTILHFIWIYWRLNGKKKQNHCLDLVLLHVYGVFYAIIVSLRKLHSNQTQLVIAMNSRTAEHCIFRKKLLFFLFISFKATHWIVMLFASLFALTMNEWVAWVWLWEWST